MPNKTAIEWCDYSSNPLRAETADGGKGHACAKISPGCVHCYSETINNRFGTGLDYTAANVRKVTHYLDEKELRHILNFRPKPPFKNGRRRPAVFPFDMTDVFGDWVSDETLDKLFAVFALRPDVDFLVLTKRAERMLEYIGAPGLVGDINGRSWRIREAGHALSDKIGDDVNFALPLPNVWLGVSCEDQQRADERIPWLLKTPAAVRFLSCEPLLGPIDLHDAFYRPRLGPQDSYKNRASIGVDWVIVGGESGPGSRNCNIQWVRAIVEQCSVAGVPCFVKQLGSVPIDSAGSIMRWPNGDAKWLRGSISEASLNPRLKDRKGGEPAEWPEDLRIRQMPEAAHA